MPYPPDDSQGINSFGDRRDNHIIYEKLDDLKENVYKQIGTAIDNQSAMQRDLAIMQRELARLSYQADLLGGIAKTVLMAVGLAVIAAILRLIFIK